jgi:2-methylaconitate cis-trans-isomerase PrpF
MTAALCTAAAAQIPGTTVHSVATATAGPLRLLHPKGVVESSADVVVEGPDVVVRSVGAVRTARRLMTGHAHVVEHS